MEKLTISSIKGGEPFVCQFNPTDFQINKTNNWTTKPAIGTNAETVKFTGGAAQDITLKLLFDNTYPIHLTGNNFDKTQIGKPVTNRKDYRILSDFTKVDPTTQEKDHTNKGEPPRLRVQWGTYITFTAVITQFSEHFLLFTPDGEALRAEVSLTLKQAEDNSQKPAQNPTSRSEPRRTWRVQQGERLDLIAYQAYGDSAAWRFIAQSNELLNPQKLLSGQLLRLPPWMPE